MKPQDYLEVDFQVHRRISQMGKGTHALPLRAMVPRECAPRIGSEETLPKVPLGPGIHLGGNGGSVLLQGVLGEGGYLITFIHIGPLWH